jgi:hypothetical protein
MKLNYRKPAVAVAIVGGVLAISGTAAFAYWTAQGTGTGTAKTADASQPLTITQAAVSGALTPGGSALPISGSVANPNTFGVPFELTAVPSVDSAHAGCQASWYTVTLTTSPTTVAANGSAAFSGTIAMADAPENQDACKGATVTVTYTAASA